MAEENHMNQGPAVSPQGEVKGNKTNGNEPEPVRRAKEGTFKAVALRNERNCEAGCR